MPDLIEREATIAVVARLHDNQYNIDEALDDIRALPASTRYAELERAARELVATAKEVYGFGEYTYVAVSLRTTTHLRAALANLDKEQGNE